ncbi:MAG: PAS domain-containing protein [Parcubacteria group bacterium]|nr:PAS domain-containing protein [Parcubacteria group bacterium]
MSHSSTHTARIKMFRTPARWFVWYMTGMGILLGATLLTSLSFPKNNFTSPLLLGATIGCALVGGVFLVVVRRHLKVTADITYAFKESRDRYAHALESAGTGTWEWDITAKDVGVYVSKRWRELYGYTEESAPRNLKEWTTLVHPDDRDAFLRLARHGIDTNARAYKNEYRIRFGTSEDYRYVRDYGSIITEGEDRKLIGSSHDETPIRIAEEVLKRRTDELREANVKIKEEIRNARKFQQAVEGAHDAIAITDTEGVIVHANDAWYTMIGMERKKSPKKIFVPFEEHTQSIHVRQLKKHSKTQHRL